MIVLKNDQIKALFEIMNAGDDLSDGGGQVLLSHTAVMFYHPEMGDQ